MSQIGYLGQASMKARVKQITEELSENHTLFQSQRKELLKERENLIKRLYPEVEEGR